MKHQIRKLFWHLGLDLSLASSSSLLRRRRLLAAYRVNTVLDVGANAGQYARQLRQALDYRGRIISFEPLSSAYTALARAATGDPLWQAFQYALGDKCERQVIHIAANSYSSSLLNMLPAHLQSAPESGYIGQEEIDVKTLDSLLSNLCSADDRVWLKIDTQGFESQVLAGARDSLGKISTVQLEMSLVPLYEGELLMDGMLALMKKLGYQLVSIEPGFSDPQSGQLLQADGIFHRS
jgi:FkbM family methyltransferase